MEGRREGGKEEGGREGGREGERERGRGEVPAIDVTGGEERSDAAQQNLILQYKISHQRKPQQYNKKDICIYLHLQTNFSLHHLIAREGGRKTSNLMSGGMWAEEEILREVISVRCRFARMILREEQLIEGLLSIHDRRHVIEETHLHSYSVNEF